MKNKLKKCLIIISFALFAFEIVKANEPFVFDVTEIEILENGNQINGYKGGTAISEDGTKIIAENFFYNKLTNILEAIGNVKYLDKSKNIIITADKAIYLKDQEKIFTKGNSKAKNENNTIIAQNLDYDKIKNIFKAKNDVVVKDLNKDITIFADKITYFKNEERVITKGKTKALIEKKYIFNSKDVLYLREIDELSSQNKTTLEVDNGNIYKLNNFLYNIKQELLKGEKVNLLVKVDKNKNDKYFFSEGFFDLKNKSHFAKETKIRTHKDIFGNEEHDPRLYGSTSYSDDKKTVINNGIFTSCKINDNCPPWSIKAEKITHDKVKKDIFYTNAILRIYDVPVLYFPKFFHPDPSVKRRDGFLQPQFNNSETLGSSLYIPYFKTLGYDKDLTFKPTFFEKLSKLKKDKYLLQSEFRKKGKNSSLIADFAFLGDYYSTSDKKTKNVNHLFLNYTNNLEIQNFTDSVFDAKIERVTNDTYLKVFQNVFPKSNYFQGGQTQLNSNLKFYLEQEDQNLSTGIEIYESLGTKKSDRYQYSLPYYDFSKNLNAIFLNDYGGSLNFTSNGNNHLKNTNNLTTTVANNLNYSSIDFISNLGFKNNFYFYLKNLNSIGKNDNTYTSSAQIDGMSIFKFDTSFPLLRSKNLVEENLTPKISLRINPGNNMNDYSGSSAIINANNVFDINRLGISNDFETGKSLTFGIDYKYDPIEESQSDNQKDAYLEFKLATVIRDQNESEIPQSSTINRKNSNLFGSINNNLLNNTNLNYHFSLDNDMKTLDSHSIGTEISINNFVTSFNYIEQRNLIGSTHLISNTTEYKLDDNTSLKFATRRNKEIDLTEFYDLSYEYKNDCLTAALRFNKTLYQDRDLVPTEDLFFSITLIPLTTYEREIYKKTPGQSGLKGWFK